MSELKRIRPFLKRGHVFLLRKFDFGHEIKAKYCVVMEDYDDERTTIIVVLTTSRMDYDWRPTAVRVSDGTISGIAGDTLIDVSNFFEIDVSHFGGDVVHLGSLPADVMRAIDAALAWVPIDGMAGERMAQLLRMKPEKWT